MVGVGVCCTAAVTVSAVSCRSASSASAPVGNIDAVKATLATVFATTRDALLQIPARMAPLLAADADPASVHNMLHAEIHQALHHLAGSTDQIGKTESTLE